MTEKQMMALSKKELIKYLMDVEEELKVTRDAFRNPKTQQLRYPNGDFMSYDSIYKEGYEETKAEMAEEMEEYNEWFADINELVGCPRDGGGAVVNVEHYVKEKTKNTYTKAELFDMINDAGLWEKDDDKSFDFEEWLECDVVLGGEVECE